uniref:Uncharacterized protein n=1 Tax=Sus scrofa TaxID=9823 RepID=A0A8W4FN97_PIG
MVLTLPSQGGGRPLAERVGSQSLGLSSPAACGAIPASGSPTQPEPPVTGPPCAPQGARAGRRSPAARQRGPRAPSWGRPGQPAGRSPWVCGLPHWGLKQRPRGGAAARPGPRSRWHRHYAAACGACAQLPGHRPQPPGAGAQQPGAAGCCSGPRPPHTLRSGPSRPGWCAGSRWRRAPGRGPRAPPGHARQLHAEASPRYPVWPSSQSLPPPAASWRTWEQGLAWEPFSQLSP